MPEKRKSILKRLIAGFIIVILLLILIPFLYFKLFIKEEPPSDIDLSILNNERIEINDSTYIFGSSWIRKSESGLWEAYLEGSAFERGVAFGKLAEELLYYQEAAFVEQIKELVPSEKWLNILKYFVSVFNRKPERHILPEFLQEIYGTSFACDPEFDFIGSAYLRQLNYHAAHDIGHALASMYLTACTSFSVWDGKSADSSLLVGRNFDFYAGEKFAENKIVCFVKPDNGKRFVMITWPCMIGVVSGMNEAGLTVTINAAKSAVPLRAATPVSILAREILQYAGNIEEAYEIASKRELFVSESILVGSAADGRTAVIEKSPRNMGIKNADSDFIISSNHFQSDVFMNDKRNIDNIKGSDSNYRFLRMEELIEGTNRFTPGDVVAVLRDMKGLEDNDIGMGNPMAINQLIAHHAVLFQPDSLVFWVSEPPYQLGRFINYRFNNVFELKEADIIKNNEIYNAEMTLPEDSFLFSIEYVNYKEFLKLSKVLKEYSDEQSLLPEGFESYYISKNPDYYLAYLNLGEYFSKYDTKKAADYYALALSKKVPGSDIRDEIIEKSERLKR